MNCFENHPNHLTGACLPAAQWQELLVKHRNHARHWTVPTIDRRSRQVVHPVEDFLFTYYPFKLDE